MAVLHGITGSNQVTGLHRPVDLTIDRGLPTLGTGFLRYTVILAVDGRAILERVFEFSESDEHYSDSTIIARGFSDAGALIDSHLDMRVWNQVTRYPATASLDTGWLDVYLTSYSRNETKNINASVYCQMPDAATYYYFLIRTGVASAMAFGNDLMLDHAMFERANPDGID